MLPLTVGCGPPIEEPPPNPWLVPDTETGPTWAGVGVTDDGSGPLLMEAGGRTSSPEFTPVEGVGLGSGEIRWFAAEGGEAEPILGLVGLATSPPSMHFIEVEPGRDIFHEPQELPPGTDPRWVHLIGDSFALAFHTTNAGAMVHLSPANGDPLDLPLGPWADADGDPDLQSVAWLDGSLFIALGRTDGPGGPPSADGPLLLRVDGSDAIEELPVSGDPLLIAPTYGGRAAAVRLQTDTGWTVHDLALGCPDTVCEARFEASDVGGAADAAFAADDDGRILTFVPEDDLVSVWCADTTGDPPAEVGVAPGVFEHAHWARSGRLSVALRTESAGAVWSLVLDGCTPTVPPSMQAMDAAVTAIALGRYEGLSE